MEEVDLPIEQNAGGQGGIIVVLRIEELDFKETFRINRHPLFHVSETLLGLLHCHWLYF